jgi:hypothetical protein
MTLTYVSIEVDVEGSVEAAHWRRSSQAPMGSEAVEALFRPWVLNLASTWPQQDPAVETIEGPLRPSVKAPIMQSSLIETFGALPR